MSSEIQYWINLNGIQSGPHTFVELQQMEITPAAYVWRPGMDDWKPITSIPELVSLYVDAEQHRQEAQLAEPSHPAVEQPAEPAPAVPVQDPVTSTPAPAEPQAPTAQLESIPECPPTNLVWAILSMVLCCLPLGVVALVYSIKVTQKYRMGDYKGAEHYSEVSAWWCIGTIIAGIVLSPVAKLIQLSLVG